MSIKLRRYYCALFGAMAGLCGWLLASFILDFSRSGWGLWMKTAIAGVAIGAMIGCGSSAWERMVTTKWNDPQTIRDALMGLVFGGGAGLLGSLIGFWVFRESGHGGWGRDLGFLILGAILGPADGLKWNSIKRVKNGTVGGAIGGLIASVIHLFLAGSFPATITDALQYAILGGAIAGSMATSAVIGFIAVLNVVDSPKGKLKGFELALGTTGEVDVIGRCPSVEIPIITDISLHSRHARIIRKDRDFFIEPLEPNTSSPELKPQVFINGRLIDERTKLSEQDQIRCGDCYFNFHYDRRVVTRLTGGIHTPENLEGKRNILWR